MSRDWEATFEAWGRPPSQAEDDERDRTETEIEQALAGSPALRDKRLSIYPKGSHRRGTNVRRGSDVDIAVELRGDERTGESWRFEKSFDAANLTNEDLGITLINFPYNVAQLKQDVYDALVKAFGERAVTWSNKCIKIREASTTLPADVVPCRTYRRFDSRRDSHYGVEIHPDSGPKIINWPQQDDDNGTAKNKDTSSRYKRAVRGIKSLENEMVDKGLIKVVPSFMMECAVYNIDDARFSSASNYVNCLYVLRDFVKACADPAIYQEWREVNRLKYLFRPSQSWTIDDLNRLVTGALKYMDSR